MERKSTREGRAPEGAPPHVEAGHAGYARSPVREESGRARRRVQEGGMESEAPGQHRELRDTVERKKEELKESASRRTEEIKSRVGDRVECLVRAIRRAGEELRNDGEPRFAQVADDAAMQVERFRSYLEGRHTSEVLSDMRRSAQSHPAYFVGGTFALGVMIGRFLKAEPNSAASFGTEDMWDPSEVPL